MKVSDVPAQIIDQISQLPWQDVLVRFLRAMRPNPQKLLSEESRLRFEQLRQLALDPSRHFICYDTEQVDPGRWSALKDDDLVARLVLREDKDAEDPLTLELVVSSKYDVEITSIFECNAADIPGGACMAVFSLGLNFREDRIDDVYINDRGAIL